MRILIFLLTLHFAILAVIIVEGPASFFRSRFSDDFSRPLKPKIPGDRCVVGDVIRLGNTFMICMEAKEGRWKSLDFSYDELQELRSSPEKALEMRLLRYQILSRAFERRRRSLREVEAAAERTLPD